MADSRAKRISSEHGGAGGRGRPRIFGRLALGLLALEVASGAALVPFYRPGSALADVEALEAGIPLGWLLRALHGYAGHLLVVLTAAHLLEALLHRDERRLGAALWWRSVLLVPLLLLAMLGGFVLRGDAEAEAAAGIWRGLTAAVPVLGPTLARWMLGAGSDLGPVLAHHAGTFTVLLWLLSAEHGRRLFPDTVAAVVPAAAVIALSAFVPLPLGPAQASGEHLLLGPWYLMGLQGLLVDLPVWTAWALVLFFLGVLGSVRYLEGRARRGALGVLVGLVLAWLGFTLRLLLEAP